MDLVFSVGAIILKFSEINLTNVSLATAHMSDNHGEAFNKEWTDLGARPALNDGFG